MNLLSGNQGIVLQRVKKEFHQRLRRSVMAQRGSLHRRDGAQAGNHAADADDGSSELRGLGVQAETQTWIWAEVLSCGWSVLVRVFAVVGGDVVVVE
jgi:hypothetical protein